VFNCRRLSKCGLKHVAHSAGSQLANKDSTAQSLLHQCDSPTSAGEPSTLLEPGFGCGLDDIWLDEFTQTGADRSQAALRRFVVGVHEVDSEMRQHDGMVAQHAVGAKVRRAAIQQVGDRCGFPTRCSRRAHLAGPTRGNERGRRHASSIFEYLFEDHPSEANVGCSCQSGVVLSIGKTIGLSRCSLRPGAGWFSILDTRMLRIWLISSASSSRLSHSGICR
jgi:hypothetical protein